MSQAKVDRYKEEKANRTKIIRKEKRIALLEKLLIALVCFAVVFWIGFSVYRYGGSATSSDTADTTAETTDVDLSAINGFYSAISE